MQYAGRLILAYLLSVSAAFIIVVPIGGISVSAPYAFFTERNVVTAVLSVLAGTVAVAMAGAVSIRGTLRWFVPEHQPEPDECRSAMNLVNRQSVILAAVWAVCGAMFTILNLDGGAAVVVPALFGVIFGAAAAVGTGLLLTQRFLRPILVSAAEVSEGGIAAPSVLTRLMGMWALCMALPAGVIAAIVFIHANGWVIERTASVETPILVVAVAAVVLGLPVMILTSRSISDPLREVVDAMAEVEHGRLETSVGAFESTEIGRLQRGFNRMVAGLAERERLRDLFGRHVGDNVARRAIEQGVSLSGDVREAAILFIDLVGSTHLASSSPPQQVAEVLNDFFRIVVAAVEERDGLINKFEGDAALVVFGAPLHADDAASSALATARELSGKLRELPMVDFGIGVSAGQVFAGNVGAENRYEYTVIGDPVNEAARLADLAKTSGGRVLCSAEAVERADASEHRHWLPQGNALLRGRSKPTQISAPVAHNEAGTPSQTTESR
jgi:adenylate cyclase